MSNLGPEMNTEEPRPLSAQTAQAAHSVSSALQQASAAELCGRKHRLRICQLRSQRWLPGSKRRLPNAQGERCRRAREEIHSASVSTLTPDTQGSTRFLSQQREQRVSGGGSCWVPAEGSTLKWPAD
ncbi:unnamed protein product [Rangifer tarandus platyrhynchus]|uniref:Uncharacterized protein n=2 Tax=Rangifer tarandus platyrhynchus TaxID=3082113 RepID=A0ACB0FL24_RANTA|nr:unnamed protein product [Rangifer tarandus platyrhynchus]CAI9713576.1 unnamed protein product [Rangifer tarandus platyrhynchus]